MVRTRRVFQCQVAHRRSKSALMANGAHFRPTLRQGMSLPRFLRTREAVLCWLVSLLTCTKPQALCNSHNRCQTLKNSHPKCITSGRAALLTSQAWLGSPTAAQQADPATYLCLTRSKATILSEWGDHKGLTRQCSLRYEELLFFSSAKR